MLDDVRLPPIFLKLEHNLEQNRTQSLYIGVGENAVFMGEKGELNVLSNGIRFSHPLLKNRRIFGGFFMSDFKTEHNIKYVLRINTLFYE